MSNQLSPEKYIISKARQLPFDICLINYNWKEAGQASIMISRKQPSGHFLIGIYLVDIFCLGLKNTAWRFNMNPQDFERFQLDFNEKYDGNNEADISLLHNIIYGAIDYAQELGFKPHKDFSLSEYILDPDLITDGIDEIEFGKDGKPFYISGPFDQVGHIMRTLDKNVGEGNYTYIAHV